MEQKTNRVKEAAIVAMGILVGLLLLGVCMKSGIDNFVNKDRKVTVKGLSEMEVEADKVIWPIAIKDVGNDLPQLYTKVNASIGTIKSFLIKNGVKEEDISVNPPTAIDHEADSYSPNQRTFRYMMKAVVTVSSRDVKLVRRLIARQGELLDKGIVVNGDYDAPEVEYDYVSFRDMKPKMMTEAIENAQKTAEQFAENSHSKLDKIVTADQGVFSIDNRDANTPYIKKLRVVTTITYSLKD